MHEPVPNCRPGVRRLLLPMLALALSACATSSPPLTPPPPLPVPRMLPPVPAALRMSEPPQPAPEPYSALASQRIACWQKVLAGTAQISTCDSTPP